MAGLGWEVAGLGWEVAGLEWEVAGHVGHTPAGRAAASWVGRPGRAGGALAWSSVGQMVVIEGLDGAGKRTLADSLAGSLALRGARTARFAFPRYHADVHAELVADALHGRLGDLGDSVHGMAVLFALDRRAAADQLRAAMISHDVVLVDRYVASNAAYGAARLRQGIDGGFVGWVRALELDRFGVPAPDLQLLLRVPRQVAAARAADRERADAARARDAFESDYGLQARCAGVYEQLAAQAWLSPWRVLDGGMPAGTGVDGLADELVAE